MEKHNHADNSITRILHGSKNVFVKQRYLNSRDDYKKYFLINTSRDIVKSYTVRYNEPSALRRFYSGIPPFVPSGGGDHEIEEFRNYTAALNEDIIDFLSERLTILREKDNPLAVYIIPELISNAVKSNYIIEKKFSSAGVGDEKNHGCMLEVVCLPCRKKPDHIDLIMRNYAQFNQNIEKSIESALHCRWTNSTKLKKEKSHRMDHDSSEYGLPSINSAIKKYYDGELFYNGYDDSYAGYGAYQFTMRLPKDKAGVR